MRLEEELIIVQSGQNIHAEATLLTHFSKLDEDDKQLWLFSMASLIDRARPTKADLEQARTDNTVQAPTIPYLSIKAYPGTAGLCINMSGESLETSYVLLLKLFKTAYQRRFEIEKDNPDNWWFWDLSKPEIARKVLTRHQELIEATYNDFGFRSEFVSLAKLWQADRLITRGSSPETEPIRQTQFNFLTYDEMVTASISRYDNKYSRGVVALRQSLENALTIQYKIDTEQAKRLVLAVIDKHLHDLYHTGLF